jgi:hypothetical protein
VELICELKVCKHQTATYAEVLLTQPTFANTCNSNERSTGATFSAKLATVWLSAFPRDMIGRKEQSKPE